VKQSKVEIQRVREQLEGEFDRVGKELHDKERDLEILRA
jgi:hypothetical protein